jgi:spermidine synthase
MNVFFCFFFLSGFCSLLYQVVWLRVAMAAFGVTTPLVSIVLSIFMAGLALGSWAGGRLVRSAGERSAGFSIRAYGLIELVIGISGLAVAPLLRAGRTVLTNPGTAWGSSNYYLASAAWIALVMLPFCTCMGATFPVAMAAIQKAFPARSSTCFSYLYLANVVGAMTGAVGSAFVFIEILGFSKTLLVAAGANAVIGCAAFIVASAGKTSIRSAAPAIPGTGAASGTDDAPGSSIVLPLLFTSGLASLGMEVVWTRQFIPVLGPVVYSFAAMLAVYLLATAAGSRIYRIWIERQPIGEQFIYGYAAILAGGCAFLPFLATDPRITSHAHSYLSKALVLLLGIGPFCTVAGFMTPMMVDRWSRGNPNRAGRAYAVNAMGCILGPLLAGFFLLPSIGERWALLVLALPFFGFGIGSWPGDTARSAVRGGHLRLARLLAVTAMTSLALIIFTKDFETSFPEARIRRDYTATSIAVGQGMQKRLLVNGIGMTTLSPSTKMMAHLPMASLAAPPRSALILCFGMGTSFRSALSWNVPVTVAELVPSVPLMFSYFHADGDSLMRSPYARVIIDDARRFMERTRESFDVIVIDPPPPVAAAGSSLLYSSEFYDVARVHLRPGGILQQWLPDGDSTVKSAFAKSLQYSFRYVRVFSSIDGWGYHFLASDSPIATLSAETLAARLPPAAARDLIEWGPASSAVGQFQDLIGRERNIQDLIQEDPSAPLLTDDRPVNEYFALRRLWGDRDGDRTSLSRRKTALPAQRTVVSSPIARADP